MRKILVIAARDYRAAVRTKSFVISLIMMPVLMGGSIVMQYLLKDHVDLKAKRFAIIDRTEGGKLAAWLERSAKSRNERGIYDPKDGRQFKPEFHLEIVPPSPTDAEAVQQQRLALSDRVRQGELFGFLEIGAKVFEPPQEAPAAADDAAEDALSAQRDERLQRLMTGSIGNAAGAPDDTIVRYQTNSPTYDAFRDWAWTILNHAVESERFRRAGIRREQVAALQQPVPLVIKGLSSASDGRKGDDNATENRRAASMILPIVLTMLMFMVLMIGATPLLQSVLEEKMQRIAEVLLGSVRPFELMLGKLLGMVGVALTLVTVYLGGGYGAARYYGYGELFSLSMILWFGAFLILAIFMYGSLFAAVGAACTDMRESQSMLMPVMLLACVPMFVFGNVIREPNSSFALWISLFPPATPLLMIARQTIPPGVPLWQPIVGIVGVIATTLLFVWMGGRIFRVGLLMQGKAPHFGELLRWVIRG